MSTKLSSKKKNDLSIILHIFIKLIYMILVVYFDMGFLTRIMKIINCMIVE